MLVARSTLCVSRSFRMTRSIFAATVLVLVQGACAQSVLAAGSKAQQPYLEMVHTLQQQNAPPAKLGYAWGLLASSYEDSGNTDEAMRAYTHALAYLSKAPEARANYATALDNLGEVYLLTGNIAEAEAVRIKAFRIRTEVGNPVDLARSHEHLAELLLAQHRFKQAEEHAQSAADTLSTLREPDHYRAFPTQALPAVFDRGNTLLSAFVTLTYAQCMQGAYAACLQSARKADEIATRDFAAVSLERAHTDLALGFAHWKGGDVAAADRLLETGLSMIKTMLGDGHPIAIDAMYEYRDFLKATHRKVEAASLDRAIQTAVASRSTGSCATCTINVAALR
jgi:hypothetical protein